MTERVILDPIDDLSIEPPTTIIKRDGRTVDFDVSRIEHALTKCFASFGRRPHTHVAELAQRVVNIIAAKSHGKSPTVEEVQDTVEMVLQAAGEFEAAKRYILYRAEHAKEREVRPIPAEIRQAFDESDRYFPTALQKFQFFDKYSRFDYELGRRETWIETVDRSVSFLREISQNKLDDATYDRVRTAILEMRAMPSMRLLAMAGPAARRTNIAIYNCSYMPVDSIDSFVEALIISMSGCGVGFSVENKYVEQFPRIKRQTGKPAIQYTVEDSAEGWAEALRFGLQTWFDGGDVQFDLSQLRPAGAPLRIKGGRASGPEPFRQMLDFCRSRILSRQGSFLRSLDAHDMMCSVGSAAVSGGVRRTAMISLFDYDDHDMLHSKDGDFDRDNSQRWNANNSAVWPAGGLTQLEIAQQVLTMVESGRGEPGIFNRQGAIDMRPERRKAAEFGTNPCGEIILRGMQFCNLTAAVARADDTFETLREKVEVATIIGTIQSMATHFPGLRPQWKENCEEERLLGVDITGQMDSTVAQDPDVQRKLRQIAVDVNKEYAAKLGINQSVSVSCVKPSGNSSQLLDCSSGLHARWAPYYIRNVRVSSHSPIYKVLRDAGVPMDPENGQTRDNATTWVIHFPVKAPEGAITRNSRTAIEQCNYWLQNKLNWTEHNPSCFTQDTRFVTSEGLQSFADFADGQEVTVLNSKGQWTQATVQHFADQEIWELVVERCQAKHTIRTTANHLWPFTSPMRRFRHTNTTFLRTDELTRYAGSSTYKLVTVNPSEKVNMELEGILHGITYGDGTKHKSTQGRKEFCQVYLCNDPNGVDSRELAPLFIEAGYEIIDREDMQQIRIYSLPNHWKELPALELGSEYLRGFIAGWFAADGHVDHRGGTVLLSSVHIESLQWLQRVAPVAGIATSTHIGEHHTESTFGPVTWYSITLSKESLDRDFFLLESKRNRFDTAHFAKYWKIVSIQPTGTYAPVSCVQVPNDEQFVLEGNILTHNCTITYKPDEVMDMMKWIWEHREVIGGMAFLPSFDANYAQLPYMEIGKDEYEKLAAEFPPIDFSKIYRYEEEDLTTAAQELACMSGSCEVDFL